MDTVDPDLTVTVAGSVGARAPSLPRDQHRRRRHLGWLVALLVFLVGGPLAPALPAGAATQERHQRESVTARIGISAGAATDQALLGLQGRALRERIPILFETADRLDVRIQTASVGQGFFSDAGVLQSEKDLDLVVSGRRDRIATMAATLGKAFSQSVVFVWFFDRGPTATQVTASIPLPGGAEALTTQVYQQLVGELADGGHVRYAGRGLIFVANTGDEPVESFLARMERVRTLLAGARIPTGRVTCERAAFLAIESSSYDDFIAGRAGAAPVAAASGGGARHGGADRRCA